MCYLYNKHINGTLTSLYPNPTGELRIALRKNAATFYEAMGNTACAQLFHFGT